MTREVFGACLSGWSLTGCLLCLHPSHPLPSAPSRRPPYSRGWMRAAKHARRRQPLGDALRYARPRPCRAWRRFPASAGLPTHLRGIAVQQGPAEIRPRRAPAPQRALFSSTSGPSSSTLGWVNMGRAASSGHRAINPFINTRRPRPEYGLAPSGAEWRRRNPRSPRRGEAPTSWAGLSCRAACAPRGPAGVRDGAAVPKCVFGQALGKGIGPSPDVFQSV